MVGSGYWVETSFDEVFQSVPNQVLLISVPMPIGDYIREGWFDARCFATLPESGALLSMTNVRGRNVLTRLGA